MQRPLRVAIVKTPHRRPSSPSEWITVPPHGYGGIEWALASLIDGLLAAGHSVSLLGAPGSPMSHPRLQVIDVGDQAEIAEWLKRAVVDIVHDHTNGTLPLRDVGLPFVSTHHLHRRPRIAENTVYLSHAQRADAGSATAPVIRLPVNPDRYRFRESKLPFLLALCRVSPWKGVYEAAQFAEAAGLPLVVAGPTWEEEYVVKLASRYDGVIQYLGEVGGEQRLDLLADARAVLVLSQSLDGQWTEPGATVVSEAAASGTPVVSTDNGCLKEIAPLVGTVIPAGTPVTSEQAQQILSALPAPHSVRSVAEREWGHHRIASEYVRVYRRALAGARWE